MITVVLLAGTGDPTLDLLLNGTPYAILVAIIIAFFTGRIVPGKQHEREVAQLREERDAALAFMRTQAEITQRALDVTEKVRG